MNKVRILSNFSGLDAGPWSITLNPYRDPSLWIRKLIGGIEIKDSLHEGNLNSSDPGNSNNNQHISKSRTNLKYFGANSREILNFSESKRSYSNANGNLFSDHPSPVTRSYMRREEGKTTEFALCSKKASFKSLVVHGLNVNADASNGKENFGA